MRIKWIWTILASGTILAIAPSHAQTYDPNYPVCIQVVEWGGTRIDCSFTSTPRRRHLASAPFASPTHISCVSLRSRTAERIGRANFACAWAEASNCRRPAVTMMRTPTTYDVLPKENLPHGLDILANRKGIVRST